MGEIDLMIEGLPPAHRGDKDPADAIPDSRAKPQVTQAGDLFAGRAEHATEHITSIEEGFRQGV